MTRSTSMSAGSSPRSMPRVQDEPGRRLPVAQVVVERCPQLLVVAAGLDEVRQHVGAATRPERLDERVHVGEQVLAHAALVRHRSVVAITRERVEDQGFLRVPATVDGRLADAGALGEEVHRQPGHADLRQQLERRREDRLVGIGAARPAPLGGRAADASAEAWRRASTSVRRLRHRGGRNGRASEHGRTRSGTPGLAHLLTIGAAIIPSSCVVSLDLAKRKGAVS